MAKQLTPIEQDLLDFINNKDSQLESANSKLVYGDGVYPGTLTLRDFYMGDQWDTNVKRGGGAKRTYNYCRRVVENNTAFLANEPPEISITSLDNSDEVENLRSELIAKQLNEVHRYNDFPFMFQKMVKVASITGVFFLFGPVWDDENKNIVYKTFENPENVRPIWRDSHFSEMIGFINRYRIEESSFYKLYEKQLKDRGYDYQPVKGRKVFSSPFIGNNSSSRSHDFRSVSYDYPMVEVREYYDDQYYMLTVGSGDSSIVVDFKEHKYGFIPGQYLPNVYDPSSGRGTSDLEDLLDSQVAYNEAKSNLEDLIAQTAYPQYWGTNLDNFGYIRTPEHGIIINLNENSTLNALPRNTTTFPLDSFEKSVQGDMISLAGQNQALFPGGAKQVLSSSGRALSVLMQPVNNNIALKKIIFKLALERLNRNILLLMEKKVKDAKQLINGNYNVQVFLSSILTRDTTEEVNKFNSKIQSLTTTMKNLGIPSPSEEQKKMKTELQDPIIGVEIARQPGLIQQASQQEQQMAQQMQGTMQSLLSNEAGETQPITAPQQGMPSPSSQEGAIRANMQRNTGVNIAEVR